jgi:hypothetical protein
MNNILQNFNEEFLSYVLTLNIEENKVVSFGNLDYDYDLVLIDGEYFLSIYNVALDHYGMPYRNVLEKHTTSITSFFKT